MHACPTFTCFCSPPCWREHRVELLPVTCINNHNLVCCVGVMAAAKRHRNTNYSAIPPRAACVRRSQYNPLVYKVFLLACVWEKCVKVFFWRNASTSTTRVFSHITRCHSTSLSMSPRPHPLPGDERPRNGADIRGSVPMQRVRKADHSERYPRGRVSLR